MKWSNQELSVARGDEMKAWVVILRGFGYVWLILASLLILAGIVGVWMKEDFSGVQDLLSPFNVINWLFTIITLAPGIGALIWANKLKQKQLVSNKQA